MPAELVSKQQRQEMILEIVKARDVHNQLELIRFLEERGITATQSSVSRDIHDLSIAKVDGRYVVAVLPVTRDEGYGEAVDNPGHAFVTSMVPSGPNLLVIKTLPGGGRNVGRSIDRARWPEVLGLVAGDETIFVATNEKRDQLRLMSRLQQFMELEEQTQPEESGLPGFLRPQNSH